MREVLAGRIGVVTGASAGIGRAVAAQLVAAGARVVINARRQKVLHEVCQELNNGDGHDLAVCVPGDASDHAVVHQMLDRAVDHFGREADLVVVNAGRGLAGSVMSSDPTQWEEMVRTNLLGAAALMREAGTRMADAAGAEQWPGSPRDLIVVGSTVGRNVSPFSSMYGSTKFALHALAEGQRRELGPRGVRVTVIEPGIVRSEFQGVAGYDPGTFGALMDRVGPVLEPHDVARAVVFACAQPPAVHVNEIMLRPTRQDYP